MLSATVQKSHHHSDVNDAQKSKKNSASAKNKKLLSSKKNESHIQDNCLQASDLKDKNTEKGSLEYGVQVSASHSLVELNSNGEKTNYQGSNKKKLLTSTPLISLPSTQQQQQLPTSSSSDENNQSGGQGQDDEPELNSGFMYSTPVYYVAQGFPAPYGPHFTPPSHLSSQPSRKSSKIDAQESNQYNAGVVHSHGAQSTPCSFHPQEPVFIEYYPTVPSNTTRAQSSEEFDSKSTHPPTAINTSHAGFPMPPPPPAPHHPHHYPYPAFYTNYYSMSPYPPTMGYSYYIADPNQANSFPPMNEYNYAYYHPLHVTTVSSNHTPQCSSPKSQSNINVTPQNNNSHFKDNHGQSIPTPQQQEEDSNVFFDMTETSFEKCYSTKQQKNSKKRSHKEVELSIKEKTKVADEEDDDDEELLEGGQEKSLIKAESKRESNRIAAAKARAKKKAMMSIKETRHSWLTQQNTLLEQKKTVLCTVIQSLRQKLEGTLTDPSSIAHYHQKLSFSRPFSTGADNASSSND